MSLMERTPTVGFDGGGSADGSTIQLIGSKLFDQMMVNLCHGMIMLYIVTVFSNTSDIQIIYYFLIVSVVPTSVMYSLSRDLYVCCLVT